MPDPQPQAPSDFAAPDDMSPVPAGFSIAADIPALDESSPGNDQELDNIESEKQAAPYWHPAWEKVETRFNELLEAYDGNNVTQFKDLPPVEFQVKVLAQQVVRTEIKSIMEDIKNAVQSVEQSKSQRRSAKKQGE